LVFVLSIEWNKTNTEKLIQLYDKKTVVWDVMYADHNSQTHSDALNENAKEFRTDILSMEKIANVRSQNFCELSKIKKAKSVSADDNVYKPTWYGYKILVFFEPIH
jgi:hypothetical protein